MVEATAAGEVSNFWVTWGQASALGERGLLVARVCASPPKAAAATAPVARVQSGIPLDNRKMPTQRTVVTAAALTAAGALITGKALEGEEVREGLCVVCGVCASESDRERRRSTNLFPPHTHKRSTRRYSATTPARGGGARR